MPKRPPQPRNRDSQEEFLNAFIERRGNISRACQASGVARSTVYVWRDQDPKFAEKFDDTLKQIEEDLFEQVMGYAYAENLMAAIFALKAINREKYDDQVAKLKWLKCNEMEDPDAPKPTNGVFVREPGPHEVEQISDEGPTEH